ncbi:MAG: glycosyltransferase family protein, partial [Pseudomonadota bacterium]
MARIIYGVQCTGHGHAMRALTVARKFPEHEFLFVSDGDGYELLQPRYPVVRCPNPESPVRQHRIRLIPAIISNLKLHPRRGSHIRSILEVMDRFQPDVAITDYEHFVPLASRRAGLPCVSLDHQHVVTCAVHDLPAVHQPGQVLMSLAIKLLFDQTQAHVITSFFQPPLKPKAKAWLFPPLLRQIVLEKSARSGEHVLAYYG